MLWWDLYLLIVDEKDMLKRLRLWNLKFELDQSSKLPTYIQIVQKVVEEIQTGRLQPSTPMPGSRQMATSLGLNRKTVVEAYEELVAQGWLSSKSRSRTYVSSDLPSFSKSPTKNTQPARLPQDALTTSQSPANQWQTTKIEGYIRFTDGVPDTRLIPSEILSRSFRRALLHSTKSNCLGYGDPKGRLELRQSVATMLNLERGLSADTEQICIVRGSQMGIFLAARVLTKKNDIVVVEELTYPPARDAFESCGANIVTIGVDAHGLNVDQLEALCRKKSVKAVYVTPHHQFSTTVMLSAERRLRLLMLAEQYGFYIIEDDYDHEFHFAHHPVLPLASTKKSSRVIYVGSLSKVLAPGLRVGYIVASHDFINQCAAEILLIDRQGNSLTEMAVSELINSGEVKRHIRRTFKVYQERRATMEKTLTQELPQAEFTLPQGGLAFWVTLPTCKAISSFIENANLAKVAVLQGSLFTYEKNDIQAIRMGFASLNHDEIIDGLKRLNTVLLKS